MQSFTKFTEIDSDKDVADANSAVPIHGGHNSHKSRADGVKRSTSTGDFSISL